MNDRDLKPYEFARRRFFHARLILLNVDRSVHERLLDALVALAPLRAEDIPRSCSSLYERVQNLVGETLWSVEATSGSLAPAVRALSVRQAKDAVRWIVMSGNRLNDKSTPDSTAVMVPQAQSASAGRGEDDQEPESPQGQSRHLT